MRILITGKNGYIARYICSELLKRGHSAECVSVRDELPDMSGADAVVHCAAIVHRKDISDESVYEKINTKLTLSLAEKAKKQGVGRFIFLSSMAVFGQEKGEAGNYCKPVTPYGRSKLKAEQKLKSCEDFKVFVVRPPMVYGANCMGNYRALRKLALAMPIFPKVNNKRSFIYVENLAFFVADICEDKYASCCIVEKPVCFNVCDERAIGTDELVRLIRKANGRKTYLSKGFGIMLKPIIKYSKLFNKIFGDLYYCDNVAEKCCAFDVEKAVELTEKNWKN